MQLCCFAVTPLCAFIFKGSITAAALVQIPVSMMMSNRLKKRLVASTPKTPTGRIIPRHFVSPAFVKKKKNVLKAFKNTGGASGGAEAPTLPAVPDLSPPKKAVRKNGIQMLQAQLAETQLELAEKKSELSQTKSD